MGTTSTTTANGRQPEEKPTKVKRNRTLTQEDKAKLHAARQAYWSRWNAAKAAAAAGKDEPNPVASPLSVASPGSVTPSAETEPNMAAHDTIEIPSGCPVDADGVEQTATVPVTPTEPVSAVQDNPVTPGPSVPASAPHTVAAPNHVDEAQVDTAEIAATKERISERWAEKQALKARDEENDFQLGKELDLLHAQRAHHGNGTYDKDVAALNIPKTTAWRLRNHYRDMAGLSPIPEPKLVSIGTNSPTESDATGTPTPGAGSPPRPTASTSSTGPQKSGAAFMRTRAQETKQVTQVRLIPSRHEIFHQALEKLSAQFGTHDDSETIFHAITTYGVQS